MKTCIIFITYGEKLSIRYDFGMKKFILPLSLLSFIACNPANESKSKKSTPKKELTFEYALNKLKIETVDQKKTFKIEYIYDVDT